MTPDGKPEVGDLWYRVISVYDNGSSFIMTYKVLKVNPCSVWLEVDDVLYQKKIVYFHTRKRWACSTEKEALDAFLHRKRRQIRILKRQLGDAQYQLTNVEKLLAKRAAESSVLGSPLADALDTVGVT